MGRTLNAGEAITAAITELVRRFDESEGAALAGLPDGVHQHRTAVRRLRSVLKVFGDLYDPFAVKHLRTLLKEWGSALGVVRDHEVAADLVDDLSSEVSAATIDDRIADRLVQPERKAASISHRRVAEIHQLKRMEEMRRLLHAFASDPPYSPAAAAPADSIRSTITKTARVVLRKSRHMERSLEDRHMLRKRARRLRHAVEAVTTDPPGLFGGRMRRVGKIAKRMQSELGDHRDSVLLTKRVERARLLAGRAGEEVGPYDELAGAAQALAEDRVRRLWTERRKLAKAVDAVEG